MSQRTVPPGKLFPRELKQGDRGGIVNLVAAFMIFAGYGDPEKIVPDGDYTPDGEIAQAVREFQLANSKDAKVTGDMDDDTMDLFAARYGLDLRELPDGIFADPFIPAK